MVLTIILEADLAAFREKADAPKVAKGDAKPNRRTENPVQRPAQRFRKRTGSTGKGDEKVSSRDL